MHSQDIPLVILDTQTPETAPHFCKPVLENEIKDIHVEHIAITPENVITDSLREGCRTVYLFVKGTGEVVAENTRYEVVPETIFLPNTVENFTIKSADNSTLHYLKIICKLSAQDLIDLQDLPVEKTRNVYHAKFSDCQSYSEAIKSPDTVSRTILSNEYIPRVAMGTVQTNGPDKVAAHEHPMLEQLFLGLSKNNCIVYADEDKVDFPQYSVVHVPLGSRHSISVEKDQIMYYVWMDFFLDKKGEDWLQTHKVDPD